MCIAFCFVLYDFLWSVDSGCSFFVLQALCRVTVAFLYIIVGDLSWCCLFVELLCFYWWFIYSSCCIVGDVEEVCLVLL